MRALLAVGMRLSGDTLTLSADDAGAEIECTIANSRQQTDLSVVKSAMPDPVRTGAVVTYSIIATNNGSAAAS
jgi:hypothetical protein